MSTANVKEEGISEFLETYITDPSAENKFNYAWALVHAENELDVEKGINWFKEILGQGCDNPVDCLFFQAIGESKVRHACIHSIRSACP